MTGYFSELKNLYSVKNNLFRLGGILIFLALMLKLYPGFLMFADLRNGSLISDPVLAVFEPVNMTWLIFSVLYGGIITAIIILLKKPLLLETALLAYAILIIFRITAMYLVPLEPPLKMIALQDPFVYLFGTGKTLSKDLFFSGHTSMMFLMALAMPGRKLKLLFFGLTFVVGISVVIQHVHYTIDVFAAPFFSYSSYKISFFITEKIQKQ